MKYSLTIASLAVSVLLFATGLSAQHHAKQAPRKGDKGGMMMDRKSCMYRQGQPCARGRICMQSGMLKQALSLSQDQAVKIDEINLEYRKKILEFREKIAPRKIALQRTLLEDIIDLSQARIMVREIADLNVEVRMLKIQKCADIAKVLTPEQRTRLRSMKSGGCGHKCPMMGGKEAK